MENGGPATISETKVVKPAAQGTSASAVEFVMAPLGSPAINGYTRATRKTPAATIVAAWMSALTGVGPSIASGNHTCKGTWPDLPTAPQKIRSEMTVDIAMPPIVNWVISLVRAAAS